MVTSTVDESQSQLARLIGLAENGKEIVIARNGRPAAKLVALDAKEKPKLRLGLADGKFAPMSIEDLDACNDEIARLFYGEDV